MNREHEKKKSQFNINDTLTSAQRKLKKGFMEYEKQRGIKDIKLNVSKLSAFFKYISTYDIALTELGVKGAQEFQTWLSTIEDETGSPYYATLTIKGIISMTSRFYNYLKNIGKVYTNPFLHIKKIKTKRKLPRNIPFENEMDAILCDLSRFWEHKHVRIRRQYYKAHVMAELMYATGMRIGEVLALKTQDVDFSNKTVTVKDGKGGRERIAYLNDYAAAVLKIYAEEMKEVINFNKKSSTIFGMISKATVSDVLHKYLNVVCEKHGVGKFTCHNFRHTLGFHLLRRGCDLRYIQLILGHKDMNTTTIYTKVDKGDLRNELDTCHPRKWRMDKNEKV